LEDRSLFNGTDELTRNYLEMDENGKEKLAKVLEKFNEVHNTVKTEVKK